MAEKQDQGLVHKALEAAVIAACCGGGYWLVEELRDPISDTRLRLAELVDRVKGERS